MSSRGQLSLMGQSSRAIMVIAKSIEAVKDPDDPPILFTWDCITALEMFFIDKMCGSSHAHRAPPPALVSLAMLAKMLVPRCAISRVVVAVGPCSYP
jgi:hypothetical protein